MIVLVELVVANGEESVMNEGEFNLSLFFLENVKMMRKGRAIYLVMISCLWNSWTIIGVHKCMKLPFSDSSCSNLSSCMSALYAMDIYNLRFDPSRNYIAPEDSASPASRESPA